MANKLIELSSCRSPKTFGNIIYLRSWLQGGFNYFSDLGDYVLPDALRRFQQIRHPFACSVFFDQQREPSSYKLFFPANTSPHA